MPPWSGPFRAGAAAGPQSDVVLRPIRPRDAPLDSTLAPVPVSPLVTAAVGAGPAFRAMSAQVA